jgi:uncharacterized surface protein with fasciclin (FAS1) repeats
VYVLLGDSRFTRLCSALLAAGLVENGSVIRGEGPFTMFAPTNDAFAKIPKETLDTLMADADGDLRQILEFSIARGVVTAAEIKDGMELNTLQGERLRLTVKDGEVTIGDALIAKSDIVASNGVIHVVDALLVPRGLAFK